MQVYPTALQLTDDARLQIDWSDGKSRRYTFRELRDACPCATCREKRGESKPASLLPILTAAEAQPLRIQSMRPVGNYAYGIAFSDGHDTGIFAFELLRELGEEQNSSK